MTESTLRINSFNVRGLRQSIKRQAIFQWLTLNFSGIHFLQETHSCHTIENIWATEWDGEIFYSHGSSNSRGVAILIDRKYDIETISIERDQNGRYIIIHCKIHNTHIVLVNIYCPTKDNEPEQQNFLKEILITLNEYLDYNWVIGGDLNTYLDFIKDKKGGKLENQSHYSKMWNSIIENYDLVDIWRIRNNEKLNYTWREKGRGGLVQSRLDYFIISKNLSYQVSHTSIKASIKSDHSIISITIKFTSTQRRGKGFWKMNLNPLNNKEYIQHIKTIISAAKDDSKNISNLHNRWDYIKCRIRSDTISFSIREAKIIKQSELDLQERLDKVEIQLNSNPTDSYLEEYNIIKHELGFIYDNKAKGIIVRSRCKFTEDNEKNTKYFLNLEKKNYNIKHIKSLVVNDKVIDDPNTILISEQQFYSNLYSSNKNLNSNMDDYLNNINVKTLSEHMKQICDQELTTHDFSKAVKDLPNNKTPGPDGIPVEFYKFFWPDIGQELIQSFYISKEIGMLPQSQKLGIINLIPKEDKDIRLLKNWRPISLLNSDYKILTKTLANKMKHALKEIINEDQIGYMENRFCGENTRLIADMIEYVKELKIPSILLLIDFEKAFDTINWTFLYKTLKKFNFGEHFIDWIKIIYKDISSCVTNNGYQSEFFQINRGIRQGDPISALLFLPVAEIMATVIRESKEIKGIHINNIEIKLCQLADDTSLFLRDVESVKLSLNLLEEFYRYAGLKINKSKTEAIILWNNDTITIDETLSIKWHNKPFKTLGIWFSLNNKEMLDLNINERYGKISTLLNIWSCRNLSLKGKITILKSLIMPHVIHLANIINLDEVFINKIDKIFFNFLWSNRKHGIQRNTIIQQIEQGGLKMICIKTMIKALNITWVKRLLSNVDAKWKQLSWHFLKLNKTLIFSKLTFSLIETPKIDFYKQILSNWFEFINIEPITKNDVLNENIHHNFNILVDGIPIDKQFTLGAEIKISNIYNSTEDAFLNITTLNSKNNTNLDILSYNSLITSIPKHWKQILRNKTLSDLSKFHKQIFFLKDLKNIYNKDIYNFLMSKVKTIPTSQNKWIEYYP